MEEADEPPLSRTTDRIHSYAKSSASDRGPYYRPTSPRPASLTHTHENHASKPQRSSPLVRGSSPDGRYLDGGPKSQNLVPDTTTVNTPPAPPPSHTQDQSKENTALDSTEKPAWSERLVAGVRRFYQHFKDAVFHGWLNVLLVFVPVGIAVNFAPIPENAKPTVVFSMNAIAIVPLAGLLAHATECVASSMGDTWASLLNVTFGNAVELIIFIIALTKDQINTVQAAILGSILANLLLILGMAFLLGGLRFQEQIYNSTVTQMSACLLSLSVTSLLLPTAFHASFNDTQLADNTTTKISRGTSVVLLCVYILYLLFQLKSHAYLYASTPQHIIDEESHPGVLADIMSSSSAESSSSSSDSDDSLGSHATAKNRFKRAVKKRIRRKSSTSSNVTASPPSATMSATAEKRSVQDELVSSPSEEKSYFDLPRRTTQASTGGVFSGDEADTDGENERGETRPQVRDFETGHVGSSRSLKAGRKRKHKKSKKKRSVKQTREMEQSEQHTPIEEEPLAQSRSEPYRQLQPRVEFKDEPENSGANTNSPRKSFSRQISRPSFRPPPLPNLLTNTVFNNPPPPRTPGQSQPAAFSIVHRSVALRRTSSLPDRLNRPGATRMPSGVSRANNGAPELSQRNGVLAPNAPEVQLKDDEDDEQKPEMSRTAAVVLLLITTGLVAFCAELGVDAIPQMVADTSVSLAFIGLIVLPIVGNAAEHVTAVTVAAKNKMDLAIGVAVGSSIQIALFVTPVVVLLGWIMNKEMSLYFNLFETISLFVTAFVVNFLVLDGRSNYLEGSLLIAAYVIIAVAAFFYPKEQAQSPIGGGS